MCGICLDIKNLWCMIRPHSTNQNTPTPRSYPIALLGMASPFHLSTPSSTPPRSPVISHLTMKSHLIHHPLHVTNKTQTPTTVADESAIPTMSEIIKSSESQNLRLQLQTLGPFFRVRAVRLDDQRSELGRAVGLIRPWMDGKILHLDSIKMTRATLGMDRSIFGLGLFVGAVAIRHGYDCGCTRAELLAINDSNFYHSKLVRFYTRMGFRTVREVDGSSLEDLADLLVWGGNGTRMDADIKELMLKWGKRFKPPPSETI